MSDITLIEKNNCYDRLPNDYLFHGIGKKTAEYEQTHSDKRLIKLGIGDVTLPLSSTAIRAMKKAADEMASADTFRGYPPAFGYKFLRSALAEYYSKKGVAVNFDEIYISDGAKSDLAGLFDILGNTDILIPSPAYPLLFDVARIYGKNVFTLTSEDKETRLPSPPENTSKPYVIFLCSPSNPTGLTYSKDELTLWVEFAMCSRSLIIFDSAYEAFIRDESPRSVFTVPNARKCSIEVGSFSKFAGFTGVRVGYTVIPKELCFSLGTPISSLWERYKTVHSNGVSYISQRGAEATLTDDGLRYSKTVTDYYLENARILSSALSCALGYRQRKTVNSPYLYVPCPQGLSSWEMFDRMLKDYGIVVTPSDGFDVNARHLSKKRKKEQSFIRLSSFCSRDDATEAANRLTSK